MTSLSTLRINLSQDYTRDPKYHVFPQTSVDRKLQQAYRQVQKDLNFSIGESELSNAESVVWWTNSYSLPTGFARMTQVHLDNKPLNRTTIEHVKEVYTGNETGKPSDYYIYWGSLYLFPSPMWSHSLQYDYVWLLSDISSSQDSQLPDDFDDAICAYAAYKLFSSVSPQKSEEALVNYKRQILSLWLAYAFNDENISFTYRR